VAFLEHLFGSGDLVEDDHSVDDLIDRLALHVRVNHVLPLDLLVEGCSDFVPSHNDWDRPQE